MGLNFQGLGKVHIGEVGVGLKGLPLQPLGVHIPGKLNLSPCDHRHLVAPAGQIQAHVPASIGPADHHHPVAQPLLLAEHLLGQPGPFRPLGRDSRRGGAYRHQNPVIAGDVLRAGLPACMDHHPGPVHFPGQIVDVVPNGPLVLRHRGRPELTAQGGFLLKQLHPVASLSRRQGRHHSTWAAADHRHPLRVGVGLEQVPLPAQPGVYGAGVVAMTAVAADTGHDLLGFCSGLELFIVPGVCQKLPGQGEQVGFPLPEIPLHQGRVSIAPHRGAGDFQPPGLEGGGVVNGGGVILLKIHAVYMGGRAVHPPNLHNVHIALQGLTVIQKILQRIARLLLQGGDLGLNEKVRPADLPHPGKDLLGQGGPLRHGFAAVFVRALVQQRGHGGG